MHLAYLALLIGVIGHASSEFIAVFSGLAGAEVSVWRFLIGAAGLLIAALFLPDSRDLLEPLKRRGLRLILLSLFGVSIPYLIFHVALDYASVTQVATLVTTAPIFIGVVNLLINRVSFPIPKLISGFCALLGVAFLLTDGYLDRLLGTADSLTGILLVMCSTAAISTYSVLAKPLINEFGAIRITTITTVIGALGLWLLVGVFWKQWINPLNLFDKTPRETWSLITIGLWNTAIAQLLWLGGLAKVPDLTRGSYLFFLKPVIAAALAYLILQQPITSLQILAIMVICGSVLAELFWPQLQRLFIRTAR